VSIAIKINFIPAHALSLSHIKKIQA